MTTETGINVESQAQIYDQRSPQEILQFATSHYQNLAVSFSGAEDVVIIDMLSKLQNPQQTQIFCLDTGRLHAETYQFIEQVRNHYEIEIETLFPDAQSVEKMTKEKGLFSFYNDGHHECCAIRKVGPLKKKLHNVSAWVTGQRKDQSPGTRNKLPVMQVDHTFSRADQALIKFNPLANWSSSQVWQYIQKHQVPYNALHDRGYISIGCEPCTRPTTPGQHERAGRWWWEDATKKECGLHIGNIENKS